MLAIYSRVILSDFLVIELSTSIKWPFDGCGVFQTTQLTSSWWS